ncbi:hypothetical protein KQX54_000579 [Cotesia glomerata]|uniref:Uncharacterized protein n=1 Tax=Cotesia glomerata TaxID=32391 RepID=A0AAV7IYP0_COTGL|nr:hypothetical protein KQX54_000579 [Cotesia glomerata]
MLPALPMSNNDISKSTRETLEPIIKPPKLKVPTTTIPQNSNETSKKGRPSNIERLRTTKSSSCPSILDFIENTRKRGRDESQQNLPEDRPAKIPSSPCLPPQKASTNEDAGMEEILEEIKAPRKEQNIKHQELTMKIEQNSAAFTAACSSITESLNKLKEEFQQSRASHEARITALETNSIKNSQIEHLQELSTMLESKAKNLSTGNQDDINKKLEDMALKLEYLEKEQCDTDAISIFTKRIIVDLKNSDLKSAVMKNKKEILDGTKVYIHPDRTHKESQED